MASSGYDWLNLSLNASSESLAPPVSFGNQGQQNGQQNGFSNEQYGQNGHANSAQQEPSPQDRLSQPSPSQPNQRPFSSQTPSIHPHAQSLSVQDYSAKNASAEQLHNEASPSNHRSVFNSQELNYHKTNSADNLNHATELSIPLSLTAQELTLQESKTYMRWYSDILARTNSRTITMQDVFNFLNNFRISSIMKDRIRQIFQKILHSINIGEFFALLRVISHCLSGSDPLRHMIKIQAPVPAPPSILSKKRHNEDEDVIAPEEAEEIPDESAGKPLDIDSFTQFMLTGERPGDVHKKKRLKKLKSVKFSDQIVTDVHEVSSTAESVDYASLSMDQLLQLKTQTAEDRRSAEEEEKRVMAQMEPQINNFQNLNAVDTALVDGTPANIHVNEQRDQLQRNMTGPAQMAQMFSPSPEPQLLKPNMTGPAQMAQMYRGDGDRNDGGLLSPNVGGQFPNSALSPSVLSPTFGGQSPNTLSPNRYDEGRNAYFPSSQGDQNAYFSPLGDGHLSPLRPNATGPVDIARIVSPGDGPEVPKISLQSFTSQMTGNTLANTMQNRNVLDSSHANRALPPPPVPSTRRSRSVSSPTPRISSPNTNGRVPPPPPPLRRRNLSSAVPPPLPPKGGSPYPEGAGELYSSSNSSTANILDDLRALQDEVDKIRDMTGGF